MAKLGRSPQIVAIASKIEPLVSTGQHRLNQIQVLNLQSLNQGLPAITPAFGAAIAEAGAICLTDEAHKPRAAIVAGVL